MGYGMRLSGSWLLARPYGAARAFIALSLVSVALSGCGAGVAKDTFDLSAATVTEVTGARARNRQVLIADPTALKALDSESVVVRVSSSEIRYLADSQWSDKLPKMVQAKLAEAFEDTGLIGGVGRPGQGLAIDYQLVTEIRAFEIDTSGADRARVEISVKLLNDRNGTVKAQQVFSAEVATSGTQNSAYVRALDRAFATVASRIVSWTLANL